MENNKALPDSLQENFENLLELVSEHELRTNREVTRKIREIRDELLMFGAPDDFEDEEKDLVEEDV